MDWRWESIRDEGAESRRGSTLLPGVGGGESVDLSLPASPPFAHQELLLGHTVLASEPWPPRELLCLTPHGDLPADVRLLSQAGLASALFGFGVSETEDTWMLSFRHRGDFLASARVWQWFFKDQGPALLSTLQCQCGSSWEGAGHPSGARLCGWGEGWTQGRRPLTPLPGGVSASCPYSDPPRPPSLPHTAPSRSRVALTCAE